MKTKWMLLIGICGLAAAGFSQAANLTWDANGTTSGQADGAGTWLNANMWWDGSANATWNNATPDNATIGNGATGGTITLGAVTAGAVLLDNFTGTYKLSGGSLAQSGGITIGASAGRVDISSGISGDGGVTKHSPGVLFLNGAKTYTGTTTIAGGTLMIDNNGSLGTGNLTINGGVLEIYWDTDGWFKAYLGAGGGQLQLTGGASGFSANGQGRTVTINNSSSYEVVWGAANEAGNANATGFFNPSSLIINGVNSQSSSGRNASVNFANKLDLNGTTRTVAVGQIPTLGVYPNGGTISGAIRDSRDNAAGLIKTGVGRLTLSGANTYAGGTVLNQGILQFNSIGAIAGTGRNVSVANGTIIVAGYAIDNTFLGRLQESTNAFIVALNAASSNALDFDTSTGANLPNASLGAVTDRTYSGTLTPNNNIYRLGGGGGTLTVSSALTGNKNSLLVSGNVTLTTQPALGNVVTIAATGATLNLNYTGTTTIKQLFIGDLEQAVGLYGPGEIELAQITGTGYLDVVGPDPAGTVMIVK